MHTTQKARESPNGVSYQRHRPEHTGLATIVAAAERIAGEAVYHYTGGARLKFRGASAATDVARQLSEVKVSQVAPGHCSIDHAVQRSFETHFHGDVITSVQGKRHHLEPPG